MILFCTIIGGAYAVTSQKDKYNYKKRRSSNN